MRRPACACGQCGQRHLVKIVHPVIKSAFSLVMTLLLNSCAVCPSSCRRVPKKKTNKKNVSDHECFPMVSLRLRVVSLWFRGGFPIVFLWFSISFIMALVWVSIGFPVSFFSKQRLRLRGYYLSCIVVRLIGQDCRLSA